MPHHARDHRDRHIFWNPEEWRKFAYNLHNNYPHCDFLHSKDMAGLTVAMLQSAVQHMPPERMRQFYTTANVKPKLCDAFARALSTRDPLFNLHKDAAPAAPVSNVVALPTATVVEAARRHRQREDVTVIRWAWNEWQLLAAQLERMYPTRNFLEDSALASITYYDLYQAQKVLPVNRQRAKVTMAVPVIQKYLRKAFTNLPPNLLPAETPPAVQAEGMAILEPVATQEPVNVVAPVVTAQEAAPLPVAATTLNPWEAAFKPLVTMLAGEMMAQLEQRLRSGDLQQLLVPTLAELLTTPAKPSAPATPSALTTPATAEQLARLVTPKWEKREHKFRVGIFSNRNTEQDMLQQEFPFFDILIVSQHQQIERLRGCDTVYLMSKFISHSNQDKIKQIMKGNVQFCNGGMTDMKRLLRGLEHSLKQHKAH